MRFMGASVAFSPLLLLAFRLKWAKGRIAAATPWPYTLLHCLISLFAGNRVRLMPLRKCPVLIETARTRTPAGLFASQVAQPAEVALALREKGWAPYRVQFDQEARSWIAKV